MPNHYIFSQKCETGVLRQGDLLKRTPELDQLLKEHHSYYGNHAEYKLFLVITQSCDLARRNNKPCKSPYVSLAAVRPLATVVRREVGKLQSSWQNAVRVVSDKHKSSAIQFIQRLLDNNEPGFFYVHADASFGVAEELCATLSLSVALKAQHYDQLLGAKIAQLEENFQSKLGWLVGEMYGKVGTVEWDEIYGHGESLAAATKKFDDLFVSLNEDQLKLGEKKLRDAGNWDALSPEQKLAGIKDTVVKSKMVQFRERSELILSGDQFVKYLGGAIQSLLKEKETAAIAAACAEVGVVTGEPISKEQREVLMAKATYWLSREVAKLDTSRRDELIKRIVSSIAADATIAALLR